MNPTLSIDLILYSAILTGVGLFAIRFPPDIGAATATVTLAGAVFCLLWGILGLRGLQSRVGPIVTLLLLAAILLPLTLKQWLAVKVGNDEGKTLAVLGTVLLAFAIVQSVNIFQRWGEDKDDDAAVAKKEDQKRPGG